MKNDIQPTTRELEILEVLWRQGQATVRDVYEALYQKDGGGYTTALKLMQVMHSKGLVVRDESERAHLFRAAIDKSQVQTNLLNDLVQRAFEGSTSKLVLQALGQPRIDREEIEAIRSLLKDIEERQ
jgi:BlaI family transcriptional regulator, penicillinase repressor